MDEKTKEENAQLRLALAHIEDLARNFMDCTEGSTRGAFRWIVCEARTSLEVCLPHE